MARHRLSAMPPQRNHARRSDDPPEAPDGLVAESAAAEGRGPRVRVSEFSLPLLFEVSWEVCCQTGGIYTVLRSKAPSMVARWERRYWLIGPYQEPAAKIEFEPAPVKGVIGEAVRDLRERGIVVHSGHWLVRGRPRVMLVDLRPVLQRVNEMKYYLWKDLGIATPPHDFDTDNAVAFGHVAADLLQAIQQRLGGRPMLAHFHEWQGGVALPLLRHRQVDLPTVFTTHATLVGRSLSAANVDLYDNLAQIDAATVARQHSLLHRFELERAAAQAATVFTTVSEITAAEAQQFLGRAPEVLLPNGLNVERFAAPHEFQVLHQQAKERIHEFVMGHFFPSYTFDLARTLYVFTAGRYEFHNKGMDLFIDALHELNRRLKAEPTGVTVVAFLITRGACKGLNVQTLNRQAMFNELRAMCARLKEDMGRNLFRTMTAGRMPTLEDLVDETARVRLKSMMHAWLQGLPPTIVTHDLRDDASDPVLGRLRQRQLFNAPDDPVKVVFHPDFLSPTSPVLGMEYDQFVRGCNLGVFASYYEPWGYTPMECIVSGVPAITSDLSGFGSYVMERFPDHDADGMYVARRRRVSRDTTIYQLAGWLHDLTRMSLRERIALRNRVESHADEFDWEKMIVFYRSAHRRAFEAVYPELKTAVLEVV